jgi:periplasmic mercuric ion binding protein
MNFSKSILTIMLTSLLFLGCKEKTSEAVVDSTTESVTPKVKTEIAKANLQSASFTIKGMSCEIGCAKTIQEELNGLDGVQTAAVDFEKESATISFDKTVLTTESISKVVEATGDGKTYTVSNMKL